MAPLPVIDGVSRVALTWHDTGVGRDAENVIHIRTSSLTPPTMFSALASHVTATMWGHTTTVSGITKVDITPLDGISPTQEFVTDGTSKWFGTGANNGVFPAGAGLVSLKTAKRGRSYRGRIYLPFVGEDCQGDGKLTGAIVTSMTTAWGTFLTAMAGSDAHVVVASYKLATADDVTSLTIETLLGTQRRRQPRPA